VLARAATRLNDFYGDLMEDGVEPLILDLLESLSAAPRPRADVMDAWRTSCPRLPVWEEAVSRGFIEQRQQDSQPVLVSLTSNGMAHLRGHRA
jgi:D-3-phosphoglycerate dehydrogenase